ncbi:MAG: hypothetical protein OXL97_11740 [Chloroflexota bacterium]|nr:hypothetical protein [Chloroflexota bacterium]MDE2884650.1 hypothetical protein [Chloroflexota bacterium]
MNQTLRAWLTLCLYITSSRRTTSTPDQQYPQHGAGDGERVHPSTRPVVLRTPPQVLLLQLFDPFSQPATSRFASSRSRTNSDAMHTHHRTASLQLIRLVRCILGDRYPLDERKGRREPSDPRGP